MLMVILLATVCQELILPILVFLVQVELSFINPPDYETKSSFEVTVSVSDGALSDSKDLVINISNVLYEVDLLVYYAPDMLSEYTSENGVETRVLYLD